MSEVNKTEMSFEEAMKELEDVIGKLERGDVPLEDSIKLYERGAVLKKICETAGAPGFENRVRSLVLKEIEEFVDITEIDNMGNIIALKKGKDSSKSVMIGAHMDEIGFIVTHINEKGFLKFLKMLF